MSNNKSLMYGLLVGGLVGSMATLLSAPSSGRDLRGQIRFNRQRLEETVNQLKSEGVSLKDQVVQTAKESAGVIKEVSADLQNSIKQWQMEIEPHKNDLQKEIEEIELKIKQLEQALEEK
ncbi:YtxH domain-containing protein [Metabacillus herbersteinensis]|uniref:YtxH domain-containing protein n=1 Tax=Metabacillus herbersteinensis TaxID=283816 RepID=A0ABV6GF87_9BACI